MAENYFITGAHGCIGAWVAKTLLERGDRPHLFDAAGDGRRIREILDPALIPQLRLVVDDLTDKGALLRALEQSEASRVIHLAALQVPFCKADPPLGGRVNVLGTLNVFEAAATLGIPHVVYASSAAVYGPAEADEVPDESFPCEPTTHYGIFKRANEGTARLYHAERGVSSVGLRPLTVYGVGRDQGLTSGPTSAMKAAVLGRPHVIAFTGATDFQYVADVATAFIAAADRAPKGAHVVNLHGHSLSIDAVIAAIEKIEPAARRLITAAGPPLPLPAELDGNAARALLPNLPCTPFEDGVRQTLEQFRALYAARRLDLRDLDA